MHDTTQRDWIRSGMAVAAAALLQVAAPAMGHERIEQRLSPPDASHAVGRARLSMLSASNGRLDLRVRGLAPNQSYDVLVGTVKVGTLRTTGGGQGALRFRTRPRGRDQMLGFDPHGALITLRGADGVDVLLGTLPAASGGDDGGVICCVPDDRGAECEDRSAAECAAQGGTVAAATSCMPNPCAAVPPPATDIVCCVPDDSGTECEDRTPAECAAQGGIAVSATSCSDNPCAATPPADPDIQCCIPDDRGPECEDRTPAQCTAQGGVNMGPGSCSPDPCASSTTPTTPGDDHGGHGGHGGGGGHNGGSDDGTVSTGDDRGGSGGTYY